MTQKPQSTSDLHPVHTSGAPDPVGPYAQAIVYNGILHTSGQIGLKPGTLNLEEGVEQQAQRVFANLEAVCIAANTSLSHAISITIYLTDLADFSTVNNVMTQVFAKHKPARSTVQVAALPLQALVEVSAICAVK